MILRLENGSLGFCDKTMTKSILRKKVYFGLLFWKDSVQNSGEDMVKSGSIRKLVDHIPSPHRKQRELQQEVR